MHTAFVVRSLHEVLKFWVEGLGGSLARTSNMSGEFLRNGTGAMDPEVRTAIARLAGQEIELVEYQGVALRGDEPLRPFDVGAMHLALHVDNLDAALERIRR